MIGTEPAEISFPAISSSRTTTCNTEFIFREGKWSGVVTFISQAQTIKLIEECVWEAFRRAVIGEDEKTKYVHNVQAADYFGGLLAILWRHFMPLDWVLKGWAIRTAAKSFYAFFADSPVKLLSGQALYLYLQFESTNFILD